MKKSILFFVLLLAVAQASVAQDVTFNKVRFSSVATPKEADVFLTVTQTSLLIRGKKVTSIDLTIPFSSLDKLSYEVAEHHRVGEGAALMVASLGAGAILMATKSKSHWLDIAYHTGDDHQSAVLRLDKSEYESILTALEHTTGKPIERLKANASPNQPGGR